MPATSEARINSSRLNGLKSKGPVSALGKSISRRNGLKHGLTGAGVVLAEEDASEVELRAGALMAELDPRSTLGKVLVGQIATLSVRMERGARQEEEALASRVRHAAEAFDHDRVDLVEFLFNTIAEDPRGNLIELRRSPEGVDRLIEAWDEVRSVLMQPNRLLWSASLHAKATHLMGLRPDQVPGSRFDLLWEGLQGQHTFISDPEWAALDRTARRDWARDRVVEQIDVEIASLKEHRATLNLEAIAARPARSGRPRAVRLVEQGEPRPTLRGRRASRVFQGAEGVPPGGGRGRRSARNPVPAGPRAGSGREAVGFVLRETIADLSRAKADPR